MASSAKSNNKKNGAEKPRISATQKKIRQQQLGMAILAVIMAVAMILALVVR
jgi:hypothetical protein